MALPSVSVGRPTVVQLPDTILTGLETLLAAILGSTIGIPPPPPTTEPAPGPPAPLPPTGDTSANGIAERVLSLGGYPVTDDRVGMMTSWIRCEKQDGFSAQWNNPMNTTLRTAASIGSANSVGVQIYATLDDGIEANLATLAQDNMGHIRTALIEGDPRAFAAAFAIDPWGTSSSCVAQLLGV